VNLGLLKTARARQFYNTIQYNIRLLEKLTKRRASTEMGILDLLKPCSSSTRRNREEVSKVKKNQSQLTEVGRGAPVIILMVCFSWVSTINGISQVTR